MAGDMVKLQLAHPIDADQAQRLRAKDIKDYPRPGMEITVPREEARAIIEAGYAANIDPEAVDATDPDAVDKALSAAPTATTKSGKS